VYILMQQAAILNTCHTARMFLAKRQISNACSVRAVLFKWLHFCEWVWMVIMMMVIIIIIMNLGVLQSHLIFLDNEYVFVD